MKQLTEDGPVKSSVKNRKTELTDTCGIKGNQVKIANVHGNLGN